MSRSVILFTILLQVATLQMFQNGILGELTKWDALMEHFQEHQKAQHHDHFFEFLLAHYWGHESDDHDHRDFPCEHFQASNIVFVHQCCSIGIHKISTFTSGPNHPNPQHTPLLDRYESNGIWHPPSA